MGAPRGNVNGVKHGGRSGRWGVVLAKLGERFGAPYNDVCRLRKGVMQAVGKRLGSIPLRERARIQTLCRLEMSCRAMEQAIRDTPDMPAEELRTNRAMIVQWSLQRDRLLAELLGDGPVGTQDPLQAYFQALQAERLAGEPLVGHEATETSQEDQNR